MSRGQKFGLLIIFAIAWVAFMNLGETGGKKSDFAGGYQAKLTWTEIKQKNFPKIKLHLLVTDSKQEPITNLTRFSFRIKEDEIPVAIEEFYPAGQQGIEALLVIDRSGSMVGKKISLAKEAANQFVKLIRKGLDKSAVIHFSDDVIRACNLTDDIDLLQKSIEPISAEGGTAFHDAIWDALMTFSPESHSRKVIIALTDGMDNQSVRQVNEVIKKAQQLGVPIYTIGLGQGFDIYKGIDKSNLIHIANETGGEFHHAPKPEQLVKLYRRIAKEIQNEYVLTYRSPTPRLDGTRRKIDITVSLPNRKNLFVSDTYSVPGVLHARSHWPFFISVLFVVLAMLFIPSFVAVSFKKIKSAQLPVQPEPPKAKFVLEIPITKLPLSIGSGSDCDIVIPDAELHHAQIERQGEKFTVRDLQSKSGTWVSFNGDASAFRRIGVNAMKSGSLVRIGNTTFTFVQSTDGSARMECSYPMKKIPTVIGSAPDCDLSLPILKIEKAARIYWTENRFIAEDLTGSSVIRVSYNGDRKSFHYLKRNALKNGSLLWVGDFIVRLEV